MQQLRHAMQRQSQRLRVTWDGEGAAAFNAEMERAVLPAMQRLIQALSAAAATTRQIAVSLREAEEQAAALFRGQVSTQNERLRFDHPVPDPDQQVDEEQWEAQDIWHRARGYGWNPRTGEWDIKIYSDISDVQVARDVLLEAGVTLDGTSWTDDQIIVIASGLADLARAIPGGIPRLRELFGGAITFHRGAWLDISSLPSRPHVPPPLLKPPSTGRDVYFPPAVAVTRYDVVHELAHVIDWNQANSVLFEDASGMTYLSPPSFAFPRERRLTVYASDPFAGLTGIDKIAAMIFQEPEWEYWAVGVGIYVYGDQYPGYIENEGLRESQRHFIWDLFSRGG